MNPEYDSRADTLAHIGAVQELLRPVIAQLRERAINHDASKLNEPEKSVFDKFTPQLRELSYGSDEYKASLETMGEGLTHHYEVNDHHPQHFPEGIREMDLIQLLEMLADWKAATLRVDSGSLERSIHQNAKRFGYGDELERILILTAKRLGWL